MRELRLAILALLTATVAGCAAAPFSIFSAGGVQAEWLAVLGGWLIVVMLVITLVMGLLLLLGALRNRGRMDEHIPVDIDGGKRWILFGGLAFPIVVLTMLFGVTLWALTALPDAPGGEVLEINVTAHQWWWEASYQHDDRSKMFTTANELHVPVGQRVKITLQSADVIHSFWVPKLHGKMDAIPGHTNGLVFEVNKPGTYYGECAEFCGVQHANMKMAVVAELPEAYERWAAHQREPAAAPDTPQLMQGRAAFEQHACVTCHAIRGTRARAGVAPDLTHFGSRELIAGTYPNTRPNLQAWIVNAQAMKAGVHMPSLDQFDSEQLNALAAYLESLE